MRRFVPASLTAQLLLLLALALVAAAFVALVLLGSERRAAVRDTVRLVELERIATLVPALSSLGPREQGAAARAASRRSLQIRIAQRPLARGRRIARLERAFRTYVDDGGVDVRIASPRGLRRGGPLHVSVALGEGRWLNAHLRPRPNTSRFVGAIVVVGLMLSLVFVLGVAWWFLRRIVRPIRALTDALERAGQGDRSVRAPVAGSSETRGAAEAFNAMQGAIERFDAERARTVAAVGHDLRTPITSLRIRAEMLDDEQSAPMAKTLDEMRVMADGLLEWGRGAGGSERREAVDLVAMLRDIAEEFGLRYEGSGETVLDARPVALRRAFSNLADNARRYGGGGTIRLEGRTVSVEDEGPGVPDDRLEGMLEPFVRGEASRSAETGGAGLGLATARDLLRGEGATLRLENRNEGGLRAVVRFER